MEPIALCARKRDDSPTTVAAPGEPIPEGCVQLHQLCCQCQQFFETWDFLDEFEQCQLDEFEQVQLVKLTPAIEDKPRLEHSKSYPFRVIAELLQPHEVCHFCIMISAEVSRWLDLCQSCDIPDGFERSEINFRNCEYHNAYATLEIHAGDVYWDARLKFTQGPSIDKFEHGTSTTGLGAFHPPMMNYVPRQSANNLNCIKRWVQSCRSQHPLCNDLHPGLVLDPNKRPTRILELCPTSIRLRCDVETILDFEYLTLSHVWGEDSSKQLRLSLARLAEYRAGIPVPEMPEAFTEAVRITREMGFKYLWIDSLCIIQDSKIDWEVQASQMTTVYANAFCTIAFLNSPQGDLIWPRQDPRKTAPSIVRKNNRNSCLVRVKNSLENFFEMWDWSDRAWTLQEWLLSPRAVLYGRENIMWECRQVFSDELLGRQIGSHYTYVGKSKLSRSPPPSIWPQPSWRPAHLQAWWDLVENYRGRQLTVPSDRVMAFTGVAKAFALTHNLTYLAGHWAESIIHCLLWHTFPELAGSESEQESTLGSTLRIPSWSWFKKSITCTPDIYFQGHEAFTTFTDEMSFSAELVKYERQGICPSEPAHDQYYNFTGLRLTLKLATCRVFLQAPGSDIDPPYNVTDSWFRGSPACHGSGLHHFIENLRAIYGEESNVEAQYFCDDAADIVKDAVQVTFALLLELKGENKYLDRPAKGTAYWLAGLVLWPGENEGTWRRSGLWRAQVSVPGETYVPNVRTSKRTATEQADTTTSACEGEECSELGTSDGNLDGENGTSIFLRMQGAKMETLTLV